MKDKYWVIENEQIPEGNREIANSYLLSIRKSKAVNTVDKYRWILEQFFLNCPKKIEELTSDDVLDCFEKRFGDKSPKTMELVLVVLSRFFRFCLNEEYISTKLMKESWKPKLEQSLPKYLTEEEYVKVRIASETSPVRDRAMIEFMFSSGCRLSETTGLSVSDIDLDERIAMVKGKGAKIREVHFSREAAMAIREYLENRKQDTEVLFAGVSGKRLSKSRAYRICRKLGKKAGLETILSPNRSRHTFATYMLARGASLEFISEELGHNDLNTTRIYARIPTPEVRNEYRKRMEV